VIELRARFDEARNIEWARNLERAGVQVIYGVKGLKTHAKICIIVRREPYGIVRYVHFGTGNYNEITARLYSDVSLMTANEEFGSDAIAFFNAITGFSQPQRFRKIDAAPLGLRERLIEMIDAETDRQNHGQKARIIAKLNSLVDPEIIEALYRASNAGVEVKLNIRGVCCLRPGVPKLSERISVVSIIDRFLEHSRILYFHHGGDRRVFISSADWMPRNLDRRVELLVPVEDHALKERLLQTLKTYFKDDVKCRRLLPDGRFKRLAPSAKRPPLRAQEVLYRRVCDAALMAEQSQRTVFEPHQAPENSH
jgi:polyphosphate kinase